MKKILSFLVSRTFLVFFGLILLIAVTWISETIFEMEFKKRILSVLFILVAFLFVAVVKKILATKQASKLESSIKKGAEEQIISAGQDQRENMQLLKSQLEKAIEALKKSKLAKKKWGRAILYRLPWYIIIGPPSSGKSTLLHNSSLYFPYMASQGKGIQGVGGTRNCDWWFSNDAVFLDTAGRYSVEEEDNQEWLGFLSLLKKYRTRKPINGSIVCVSISELLEMTDEELETFAQKLRNRIDELIRKLKIKFPVYIVFTKCDLIHGFVDFFGNLSRNEREQVWGCSFSSDETEERGLFGKFQEESEKLIKSLNHWRLDKLSTALNQNMRNKVFLFPLQFSSSCKRLSKFIELLSLPNPYQETPYFRGFYFTSATQEGNPIDQVVNKIGSYLKLPEGGPDSFGDDFEKKSYFIKDFFTKITFPDQNMAFPTTPSIYSNYFSKLVFGIFPIITSVLLIFAFSYSYINNKNLLNDLHSSTVQVGIIKKQNRKAFSQNLFSMEQLKNDLQTLITNDESGTPLELSLGLYRGDRINAPSQKLYFNKFKDILLNPVSKRIEKELAIKSKQRPKANTKEWQSLYNSLKLYLLMIKPSKDEFVFMKKQLHNWWKQYLTETITETKLPKTIIPIGLSQMDFYLSRLFTKYAPRIKGDKKIIFSARRVLQITPSAHRFYADIKKTGMELEPFHLRKILKNEERIIFSSKKYVEGMFTKDGWDTKIRDSINNSWVASAKEDFVLANKSVDPKNKERKEKLIAELKKIYKKDYVEKWLKFLKNVSITPFDGLEDATARLAILSNEASSPFITIFQELLRNMELEKSSLPQELKKASEFVDKIREKLGFTVTKAEKKEKPHNNPLAIEYSGFLKFAGDNKAKKEGAGTPLSQYLESLRKVYEKFVDLTNDSQPEKAALAFARKILSGETSMLNNGIKVTESLMRDFSSPYKTEIRKILIAPFDHTWEVISRAATLSLNEQWKNRVYSEFKENLAGKYPFLKRHSIDEVSVMDLSNFLNPNGGTYWEFHNANIKPFIKQHRNKISAKKWRNKGIDFSPSFFKFYKNIKKVSNTLFQNNKQSPIVLFSIHPHETPQVAEVFVEINGKNHLFLNSPDEWSPFSWPVAGEIQGAEISIKLWKRGWDKEKLVKKSVDGLWGFFKLLDNAKIKQQSSRNFQVVWEFDVEGYSPVPVTFQIKTKNHKSPFKPGFFSSLICPKSIS